MNTPELMQVITTVAANAPLLIQDRQPFPTEAGQHYWAASKCRLEHWGHAIKDFTSRRQSSYPSPDLQDRIQPILEEILHSEVLSRVWAAVCSLADKRRGTDEFAAVTKRVLADHLEMRTRVLNLMVYSYGLRVGQAVALNQLRICNETWTDTILSLLGPAAGTAEWAFQPERVRKLAASLRQDSTGGLNLAKSLLLATLGIVYQRSTSSPLPHAELNRQIASSILACFPPYFFDATGRLSSLQQLWLMRSCADIQGKVNPAAGCIPSDAKDLAAYPFPPGPDPNRRFDLS